MGFTIYVAKIKGAGQLRGHSTADPGPFSHNRKADFFMTRLIWS